MTPALTLEEVLGWSNESSRSWFRFLSAHPELLTAPCGIYKTANVLGLVRHIVTVELRYSQRLAGLPVTAYQEMPEGPLDAFVALHDEAIQRLRTLLADSAQDWEEELEFVTLSAGTLRATRRKILAHAALHAIRHWAQLATLSRTKGYAPNFAGDLIVSSSLR